MLQNQPPNPTLKMAAIQQKIQVFGSCFVQNKKKKKKSIDYLCKMLYSRTTKTI